MTGKFCVITGASSGIGLATACELANRGWRLRIVGRSPSKLAAAQEKLAPITKDLQVFRANFSSLADVRRLASELLQREEPLHVLINNAGVWHPDFQRSEDGYEDTFAVNHLAPFLLTQLLLPRLRETKEDCRIVHVTSRLHIQAGQTASLRGRLIHAANILGIRAGASSATFDIDALDRREGYKGLEAYARSKLAQVIYSRELARREKVVTSYAVHPGSVMSDVTRDSRLVTALAPLAKRILKTPEQGARTSVFAATDPSLSGISGRY
jgi:retinol dehydrogenase 14